MSDTVQITVDGRPTEVRPGSMLLGALRARGVQVPTLCDHPSLEPSGACRLCVVEVTHEDWRGWSGLVTSCLYPIEAGLQVFTGSQRVRAARRSLVELYLADCPDSETIRDLARSAGVDVTPYPARAEADLCIHCGLCIRVCQELGPGAIAALGRGTDKHVGPRPDGVGEDCTGCRACAYVCPTGEIQAVQEGGKLTIWKREFPVPVCSVEQEACRGCGVCEEVCPWSIPRVVARRSGAFGAEISAATCVGCGICAGACPTGAIAQRGFPDQVLTGQVGDDGEAGGDLVGRSVVYACSRSPFPAAAEGVIEVPCVGRVAVDGLLACLARGADGVLVVCRDQRSCPYGAGGALGERHVAIAEELAAAAGLGAGRVRFLQPPPGLGGPAAAVTAARAALAPSPLATPLALPPGLPPGLDRALLILAWLQSRPELEPTLPRSLAVALAGECGEAIRRGPAADDTLLFLGNLPELDLLLSLELPTWRLRSVIVDAVRFLGREGMRVKPVTSLRAINTCSAARLVVFGMDQAPPLERELEVAILDELAARLEPEGMGAGAVGFSFRLGLQERQRLVQALRAAAPGALRCTSPHALAQLMLLRRPGAWEESISLPPIMTFSDAPDCGVEEEIEA